MFQHKLERATSFQSVCPYAFGCWQIQQRRESGAGGIKQLKEEASFFNLELTAKIGNVMA